MAVPRRSLKFETSMNYIILILTISTIIGCKTKEPISTENSLNQVDTASDLNLSELAEHINDNGGEVLVEEGVVKNVHIIHSLEKCIPHINKLPSVEVFYLSYHQTKLSDEDFNSLRVFPEAKIFHILYGVLSRESFSNLAVKFPNIEEFTLHGNVESDLSSLSALKHLKEFRSDADHTISLNEAQRISKSKNLEVIEINRASSRKVFDLLKELPKLKELSVQVFDSNEKATTYNLP